MWIGIGIGLLLSGVIIGSIFGYKFGQESMIE